MNHKSNCPVSVHNEWDPLEEVIIGSARYAQNPFTDLGFRRVSDNAPGDFFQSPYWGRLPEKIVEETEEDIAKVIEKLQKLNITVKRPDPVDCTGNIKTPFWESEQFFSYCPRDILLAIGDMIIEAPCVFRSRYLETLAYKKILNEYMQAGARWIAAPRPSLKDDFYNEPGQGKTILKETEPVFDAANILRAGRDIFYMVSDGGNKAGATWLQNILGKPYRVHTCHNLYSSLHIDTTIVLLSPGLVLINPSRVNDDNLPPLLKKWKVIKAPEMVEKSYSDLPAMSSKWLGMNLLMLNPGLALVDQEQTGLIRLLESHGIDTVPALLRHGRTLAGGFHCFSLDTRRKGTLESYF